MTQNLVKKQSMMMPSSGTNSSGQFPAGLRVLAVDDDATCLMYLVQCLVNCNYHVTQCTRAEDALSILRANKNGFDIVISDVHMPDMDGFKLLVHVGLEMDLPVIMMSADDSKSVVMKGITHGACDYLIKPVRIDAIRNIWQHVVRKRKHVQNDLLEPSTSLDNSDQQQKQPEDPDYYSSANEEQHVKNTKRKIEDEDEYEYEETDESSSSKKSRVVWSQELHQQFVAAVNQIGYGKAVPKKILELMSVPGLTRENVASHLQKFRMYLKKLGGSHPSAINMVNPDAGYGSIPSISERDLQALAAPGQLNHLPAQSLATLHAVARGGSGNMKSAISVPLNDQKNIFSFENQKLAYGQVQNRPGHNSNIIKPTNFFHGIPTNMDPRQLAGLQQSFTGLNSQATIPITSQSQTYNLTSRPPNFHKGSINNTRDTSTAIYNPAVLQNSSLIDFSPNHRTESPGNTFLVRNSSESFSMMSTSTLHPEGYVPTYGLSNHVNQNQPHYIGLQGVNMTVNPSQHTNNMQAGLNGLAHNYNSGQRIGVNKVVCPQAYSQVDLPNTILTQPQQQGIGELAPNTWYSLDNLPA